MARQTNIVQMRSGGDFSFGLRIGPKIIAGYLFLIVLMAVVAGVAYWGMDRITAAQELALERETEIADLWAMQMYMDNQYGNQADLIINGDPASIEEFQANVILMDKYKDIIRNDAVDTDEEIQLITEIDEIDAQFDALFFEQVVPAWEAGDEALLKELDGQSDELVDQMEEKAQQMIASFENEVIEARQEAQDVSRGTTFIMIAVAVVAAVVGLGFGFWLSGTISRPVQKVAQTAEQLAGRDLPQLVQAMRAAAEGDLTANFELHPNYVDVRTRDEVGQMAQAFNGMNEALGMVGDNFVRMLVNLRDLVGQVQQSASQVASASIQLNASAEQAGQASQQVASTSQQVASGTSQQTQSVTDATGNVDQMARAAQGVARGSQDQAKSVQTTSQLVSEMADIVDEVRGVVQLITGANGQTITGGQQMSIRARTADAVEKVKEMDARSREIGRIIETIDEIADKTDMLALNAAVEAARAGEHGRGFAVVADQVRKLSEDSKTATRDIADLIARVQGTVNDAIGAMEGTSTEVDKVAASIDHAVAQLKQKSEGVVASIESVSAVVEENTAVAEEMAANTEEVTATMESIASIAEENSAATEEVSASAEEMSAQVEEVVASAEELSALAADLQALTQNFKLRENEDLADKIELFKQAHLRWVDRLNDMVAGRLNLQENQIESHHECILGRWYYLTGKAEVGHLPEYVALEEPHAGIHEALRHAVAGYNRGDRKAAEAGAKEVRRYSYEIVNLLDQLERKAHRTLYTHAPSQSHSTPDYILAPAGHQGNDYSD